MNVSVIVSKSNDVYENLAEESLIFDEVSREYTKNKTTSAVLMLWQNDDCVVIGKNQDPYRECDLEFMAENNIRLARRPTGGGAVFHDGGNLNFTFILSRDIYDSSKTSSLLLSAFISVGIPAELSGRNDILADGKKFSGNAFRLDSGAGLHHGTVLINASTEKIAKALTPSKQKLGSKGIKSVASRTVNLKAIDEKISAERISDAIESEFLSAFGNATTHINLDINAVAAEKLRLASDEWLYGSYEKTVNGKTVTKRFPWGCVDISVAESVMTDLSSDALDADFIGIIRETAINAANPIAELQKLSQNATDAQKLILSDIISVLT